MRLDTCTAEEFATFLSRRYRSRKIGPAPWSYDTMEELFEKEVLPIYDQVVGNTNYSLELRNKVWKHLRTLLPDLIIELKAEEKFYSKK